MLSKQKIKKNMLSLSPHLCLFYSKMVTRNGISREVRLNKLYSNRQNNRKKIATNLKEIQ
jgi:hypothetical protein